MNRPLKATKLKPLSAGQPSSGGPSSQQRFLVGRLVTVMIVLILLPLPSCGTRSIYDGRIGTDEAGVGQSLEGVTLTRLEDEPETVRLAELSESVLLVNFWGVWCPPCVKELPHLVELAESYRDRSEFRFLPISCSLDSAPEDLQQLQVNTEDFLAKQSFELPRVYADPDWQARRRVFSVVQSEGLPTTVILDRNRTIRGVWKGYVPADKKYMQQLVDQLLAE